MPIDRLPEDNPQRAVLSAVGSAASFAAFFMLASPDLRNGLGAGWVLGAGAILGAMVYCHRRAAAYLRDDSGPRDILQFFRLLNPARYEVAGQGFVRWQRIELGLFALWWLIGGSWVGSRT
jgi:hypothetical protein